jgi:protocatechuate 3,4-dioxygenase beta subunit
VRPLHLVLGLLALALVAGASWATRRPEPVEMLAPAASREPQPESDGHRPATASAESEVDASGDLWLEGRITDVAGRAAGGVSVVIDTRPARTVVSDDAGIFVFDGLQPGRNRLVARGTAGYAGPVDILVTAQTEPVELVLRPAHGLEVAVLDGERDEAPIEGASVDIRDPSRQRRQTLADGLATFPAVAPGTAWLSVSAPDRATTILRVDVPEGRGTLALRVVLDAGRVIEGVVLTPDGDPAVGAKVATRIAAGPGAAAVAADVDGGFSVRVPDGVTVTLRATAVGFVAAEITVPPDTPLPVTLTLGAGRTLSGIVTDDREVPLASAVVRGITPEHEVLEAVTDPSGAFELQGVPPAPIELLAVAGSGLSEPLAVAGGDGSIEGLALVVPTRGWIRGVVRDADGEPLANATVHASPDLRGRMGSDAGRIGRGAMIAVADDEGHFALEGLRPGRYALRPLGADEVGADPITRTPAFASTGQDDVVVTRLRGGRLTAAVVDAAGAPVAYTVRVDTGAPHLIHDATGRFSIDGIAAGPHVVTIDGRGLGGFELIDVEVREGETTDLGTLRDDGGRRLEGRVVDGHGLPVAGARVLAGGTIDQLPDGTFEVRTRGGDLTDDEVRTDREGAFEIVGLPPGPLVVVATHPAIGRSRGERVTQEISAMVLELLPTASIRGTVIDVDRPAVGAAVTVSSDATADVRRIAMTDDSGAFTLEGVPAGPTTVTALRQGRHDRQRTARRAVEVVAGIPSDIELRLGGGDGAVRVRFEEPGDRIVMLASGTIEARSVAEFQAAASRGDGTEAVDFSLGGEAVVFDELEPGRFTVCAVAIERDVDVPAQQRRTVLDGDNLALSCVGVELDAEVASAVL